MRREPRPGIRVDIGQLVLRGVSPETARELGPLIERALAEGLRAGPLPPDAALAGTTRTGGALALAGERIELEGGSGAEQIAGHVARIALAAVDRTMRRTGSAPAHGPDSTGRRGTTGGGDAAVPRPSGRPGGTP